MKLQDGDLTIKTGLIVKCVHNPDKESFEEWDLRIGDFCRILHWPYSGCGVMMSIMQNITAQIDRTVHDDFYYINMKLDMVYDSFEYIDKTDTIYLKLRCPGIFTQEVTDPMIKLDEMKRLMGDINGQ